MAYTLEAIIGKTNAIDTAKPEFPHFKVVPLSESFSLIPLTETLIDDLHGVHEAQNEATYSDTFWKLAPEVAWFARDLSKSGTVVYVEAEFFGGVGEQAAIIWENRQVIAGPWRAVDAINQALRQLGVDKGTEYDEFEAIGLGQHRATEEWSKATVA
jgi:hypothetical protein